MLQNITIVNTGWYISNIYIERDRQRDIYVWMDWLMARTNFLAGSRNLSALKIEPPLLRWYEIFSFYRLYSSVSKEDPTTAGWGPLQTIIVVAVCEMVMKSLIVCIAPSATALSGIGWNSVCKLRSAGPMLCGCRLSGSFLDVSVVFISIFSPFISRSIEVFRGCFCSSSNSRMTLMDYSNFWGHRDREKCQPPGASVARISFQFGCIQIVSYFRPSEVEFEILDVLCLGAFVGLFLDNFTYTFILSVFFFFLYSFLCYRHDFIHYIIYSFIPSFFSFLLFYLTCLCFLCHGWWVGGWDLNPRRLTSVVTDEYNLHTTGRFSPFFLPMVAFSSQPHATYM